MGAGLHLGGCPLLDLRWVRAGFGEVGLTRARPRRLPLYLKVNVKGAEPARLGVTSWGRGLFYAPGAAVLGGSLTRGPQKRPDLLG